MNIRDYTEELISLRHHFHQHPELALQEVETSAYIRRYLEKLGYEITPVEPTGLIAELPGLKCQIRSSGMPQADRDQKLNRMVVILRDCSSVICFQHSSGLPECSVKKLEPHTALPHLFWQTCRILLISENMVILGNHRQIRVKYQI